MLTHIWMFLLNPIISTITKTKPFSNSVQTSFNFILFNLIICFTDNTDLFTGCPVGLQLIGRTLEEEAVLRMTYIVDEALKKQKAEH